MFFWSQVCLFLPFSFPRQVSIHKSARSGPPSAPVQLRGPALPNWSRRGRQRLWGRGMPGGGRLCPASHQTEQGGLLIIYGFDHVIVPCTKQIKKNLLQLGMGWRHYLDQCLYTIILSYHKRHEKYNKIICLLPLSSRFFLESTHLTTTLSRRWSGRSRAELPPEFWKRHETKTSQNEKNATRQLLKYWWHF